MLKPVTLITGASSGLGAAFARVFAQHGHELVLIARRQENLERLADAIAGMGRQRPDVFSLDLIRADAGVEIAGELAKRRLAPAMIVNSAGFGLYGLAHELDLKRQLEMVELNVRILTDLSLRFVEPMAQHGGGLLNIASLAGFFPGPRMALYCACKAYVLSFTAALHQELSPKGVKVTAFCPGPVRTEFFDRAGIAIDQIPRWAAISAERAAAKGYRAFMKGQPLVVPGVAAKIAAAAPRFLPRSLLLSIIAAVTSNVPLLPRVPHHIGSEGPL